MWCGSCYTSDEGIAFHVRQDPRLGGLATEVRTEGANDVGLDEDRLGNFWRTSKPDERAFHYARNGDHLMVAFECDFCVFSKIRPGERPNLMHECDTLLLACIRRVNLDSFWSRATRTVDGTRQLVNRGLALSRMVGASGPYCEPGPMPLTDHCGYEVAVQMVLDSRGQGVYHSDHKQFDTIRRLRSAFHSQAACSAMNSSSIMALGNERGEYQRFAREPTASVWFQRFMTGCKRRMGQDWRPNTALSNVLMHKLLEFCESQYKAAESYDETAEWIVAGTYFATCYVCSLRGPEGLLVDQAVLPEHIEQEDLDVITVPLLGKVKGESHARQHLLHSVALTSSGIPMKLWYLRLLRVHRGYGRTKGPAICDKDGFQLGSRDLNLKFWEALTHIWEQAPKLFLSNIKTADDIELHFNVYRSFRRGSDSRAIEQGLDKTVTDTVNRWKVIERSGGSKPGHGSMSQYYADANLLKKVHLKYTFAM
jgi:hypothetical protein